MARLLFLTPFIALVGVGVYFLFLQSPPPLPDLDYDAWWGPESLKAKQDLSVKPFKIKFKDTMIQDLKQYLKTTRKFVPPLEGTGFEYGFNTQELQSWLTYWAEKYPFAEREKFLNQYSHYKTNIQGLNIHFIHVKPEVPAGVQLVPVLLLHGWPGSVREFYEAVPLLTAVDKTRDFALELIIPSLPGYGFSDAAVRPGLGVTEMGVVLRNLMHRLGFKQFYVQGGDWGSLIGSTMATVFPKEILGYHTNIPLNMSPTASVLELLGSIWPSLIVDPEQADRLYPLGKRFGNLAEETGYLHIQATKPDTVGVALSDSPAGLFAYIAEKFSTWTNPAFRSSSSGELAAFFTKDQILDNIMIYWSTQSITTSMRLYAETFTKRHFGYQIDKIPTTVPTWALQARHELGFQPPSILRLKYRNLIHATALDDGGHFLAFQLPKVFAEDVLKAVEAFRDWHKKNERNEL